MRRSRMTPRSWMLTVLVVGGAMGSFVHAERCVLRSRYRDSLREHAKARTSYYDEGRVTALWYAERSHQLMVSEYEMSSSKEDRDACISDHLARVRRVIRSERDDLERELNCRGGGVVYLAEVVNYLAEFEATLKKGEPPQPLIGNHRPVRERVCAMRR